ncbi:large neutral amino acids transporter small subunit 4 [Elysia marginata]|uniref:Large neutral amino acids transporter small subunit 4 n=1 Tax=Elysia marginata TaxID=1093978 RepID=A0AAV4JD84_9GAST|nr:large neutral amino acids transporter small subunit 4 [Elysia marginata]
MQQPADQRLRYVYAVWAFLEIAVFGGVIFGWGSLVYVFKGEDLYGNLCGNETTHGSTASLENLEVNNTQSDNHHTRMLQLGGRPCHAQDAMLNLVFSVTSSFYCLATFAAGQINYKFGTRVTRLLAT